MRQDCVREKWEKRIRSVMYEYACALYSIGLYASYVKSEKIGATVTPGACFINVTIVIFFRKIKFSH